MSLLRREEVIFQAPVYGDCYQYVLESQLKSRWNPNFKARMPYAFSCLYTSRACVIFLHPHIALEKNN